MSFYGKENAGAQIAELYEELCRCWCRESCASRMRENWSEENRTLGQCSITSIIVQELYGGRILGVPLADGGMHCFNEIDGVFFDLTSEQFGERAKELVYTDKYPQTREAHLSDPEKHERYRVLKARLEKYRAEKEK